MDDCAKNWLSIPARREIAERLERVQMPADAKLLMSQLVDLTMTTAGKVFEIGKQVIVFAFDLVSRFRTIAFRVVVALTVSSLVGSVPIVGLVLKPLLEQLLVAFALTMGALKDVETGALHDIKGFSAGMQKAVTCA